MNLHIFRVEVKDTSKMYAYSFVDRIRQIHNTFRRHHREQITLLCLVTTVKIHIDVIIRNL